MASSSAMKHDSSSCLSPAAAAAATPVAPAAASAEELAVLRDNARRNMAEATKRISMKQKAAYLEALEKAPHLFESECDPLKFLRTCHYDIWAAADRLCSYWRERKELFGPDRAFLPLTLTSDGALNENDILSLKAGFPALLPPATAGGQKVVYFDRQKHVPGLNSANRVRALFYAWNILSQDERAQTEGVIVLILAIAPQRVQDIDTSFIRKVIGLARDVWPVKICQLHVLNWVRTQSTSIKKKYFMQDIIGFFTTNILQATPPGGEKYIFVHFERDGGEIREVLQHQVGLSLEGIPMELGGTWAFVNAASWCIQQAMVERKQFKNILDKSTNLNMSTTTASPSPGCSNSGSSKKNAPGKTSSSAFSSSAMDVNDIAKHNFLAKKRAVNVVHSRMKRERRKHEINDMANECKRLTKQQEELRVEHERLQQLLLQARFAVENQQAAFAHHSSNF